jgi:hypothetical protein
LDSLRKAAENMNSGGRNYWNLLKMPDESIFLLSDALKEMERQQIIATCHYRVKPMPAFKPWLDDLRSGRNAAGSCTRNVDVRTTTCPVSGQRRSRG